MPKCSKNINHLAYANDTIIFAFVDRFPLLLIMKMLGNYER